MKNGISEATLLRSKKIGKIGGKYFYSVFRLVILLSIGFVVIYPLFYMFVTSVQTRDSFLNSTKIWIPDDIDIKGNYKFAADLLEYGTSFLSTMKSEVVSALIEVVSCSFIAYGFARFKFKGRNILMFLLLVTILVPDMMMMIPRMTNYSDLDFLGIVGLINKVTGSDIRINMLNSVITFWLPSFLGIGLRSGILIFIYIQFFSGLPVELEEASWVDGAGPIRTFISIAIPSSGVVIITVTVFSLIWHWNDFLLAGMYLSKEYPLAYMVNMMTTNLYNKGISPSASNPQAMAYLMAGCVLFVIPMLVVYMILQHWFIESIDRVGITG